jgi:2-polyprenyl-3-methyl-5-hydroxy-6-metoxy-1,4-benzoquinol methylase
MSAPGPNDPKPPPWMTCLDVEGQDAAHYRDHVNEGLLQGIPREPAYVLELGCAAGAFGQALKARYPQAHVTGIEASHAAAEVAATRIDRVINARLEDVDFAAENLRAGTFDLVIAGDVLEHMVNPWIALTKVRPLIAPAGALVASIPNVRNLQVIATLALEGRFEYRERGLLDVTHLRFFTLTEIRLMFEQTGYALEHFLAILSPALQKVYQENQGSAKLNLRAGRLAIDDVTPRELTELCADQFIVRASVRSP